MQSLECSFGSLGLSPSLLRKDDIKSSHLIQLFLFLLRNSSIIISVVVHIVLSNFILMGIQIKEILFYAHKM